MSYSVISHDGRRMDWPHMGQSQGMTYGQADAIIGCSILTGADVGYWKIIRDRDGMVMLPYAGPPVPVKS